VAYSKRFDDALLYAVDVHRDQVRKGSSIPYVTHLLGVASIVGESGGSEDEVIAELLHDAIEDTDATYTTLADRFDKPVADIVRACSDTDVTPKPAWEKRKKDYIAHVVGASESVWLVSAADKLANAHSVLADLRVLGDEHGPGSRVERMARSGTIGRSSASSTSSGLVRSWGDQIEQGRLWRNWIGWWGRSRSLPISGRTCFLRYSQCTSAWNHEITWMPTWKWVGICPEGAAHSL
jgi:hypothetical protein